MKYYAPKLTTKRFIKGILLCAVFVLGLSELAKAGTADDPPPPLAPPITPTIVPPPPPPPPPPPVEGPR